MQAQINRITDILRRDDGISGAMHYTEQISWVLFLKFLDDFEEAQRLEYKLKGEHYSSLLDYEYQRDTRAAPKKDGKIDAMNAMTGDDLKDFVNKQLFPYLKAFRDPDGDYHSMKYKIGEIFHFLDNRIESWHTLREVIDIIDKLNFQSHDDLFELSKIYEDLLQGMGNDGGNSGEYYTPRSVINAMVECVDPQIGETVYDGAAWSCGFLIEAYLHLRPQAKTTEDLHWLDHDALRGNEKTPIAYIMGVMNMILHGVTNPNINKKNTLTDNIYNFEEKDRYNIILANPPFGGKEKEWIQANFLIKTNSTEMLFLQHFMKKLKTWGKAAIIVPEWVLFNTSKAFQDVKKMLLEDYNLHSIVSLPAWVFLPYSWVKTNIIFFDKTGSTQEIRYYEINPDRKLTKNKPINYEDMKPMISAFKNKELGENAWKTKVEDIKDYDLSAKNPAKIKEIIHESPADILEKIMNTQKTIEEEMKILQSLIK
jgi:type I restriction enzyme M protein